MQDYTFIDDGNPNFLDPEERIINFDKRTRMSRIITELSLLQNEKYKIAPIDEVVEILLCAKGWENDHEDKTYEVSKYIENVSGVLSNDNIYDYLVHNKLIS